MKWVVAVRNEAISMVYRAVGLDAGYSSRDPGGTKRSLTSFAGSRVPRVSIKIKHFDYSEPPALWIAADTGLWLTPV
nr:hypothetical protein [Mucilaginibacter sp. E4BP6]